MEGERVVLIFTRQKEEIVFLRKGRRRERISGSPVIPEGDYTFMCTGRYRGQEDRRTPT